LNRATPPNDRQVTKKEDQREDAWSDEILCVAKDDTAPDDILSVAKDDMPPDDILGVAKDDMPPGDILGVAKDDDTPSAQMVADQQRAYVSFLELLKSEICVSNSELYHHLPHDWFHQSNEHFSADTVDAPITDTDNASITDTDSVGDLFVLDTNSVKNKEMSENESIVDEDISDRNTVHIFSESAEKKFAGAGSEREKYSRPGGEREMEEEIGRTSTRVEDGSLGRTFCRIRYDPTDFTDVVLFSQYLITTAYENLYNFPSVLLVPG